MRNYCKLLIILMSVSINSYSLNSDLTQSSDFINPDTIVKKLNDVLKKYEYAEKFNLWDKLPPNLSLNIGDTSPFVSSIKNHLKINGEYLLPDDNMVFDENLSKSIKLYQLNNGLKATGVLNTETISSLNYPKQKMIQDLKSNISRALFYNFNGDYILINIPFFNLYIVENNKIIDEMNVIVGKPQTPSCELDSKIYSIVFNPSWYVPKSIANKEMIPKLDSNPEYFDNNNFHLFYNNSEITIDEALENNFKNIKFVQYPSSNNALGKIKFLFDNNCGIYLHDTNQKNLFTKDKKGLSHGCIRLSQPYSLANYLLNINNLNSNLIETYKNTDQTKTINLKTKIDIHIIYLNVYVNSQNEVVYRKDIYNKNNN